MTGDDTELTDLAPSAKLVYKVLEIEGELTQKEIVEETRMAPRTVRYALKQLESIGVVEENIHLPDARQSLYRVTESDQKKRG